MYDRSVIRDHLQDFVVKPPLVVDVSKSNCEPRPASLDVYNEVQDMIAAVLEQVNCENQDSAGHASLKADPNWNLTTLYGLLLGFPVVYWFNQTEVTIILDVFLEYRVAH